jgi:hypothetical protein
MKRPLAITLAFALHALLLSTSLVRVFLYGAAMFPRAHWRPIVATISALHVTGVTGLLLRKGWGRVVTICTFVLYAYSNGQAFQKALQSFSLLVLAITGGTVAVLIWEISMLADKKAKAYFVKNEETNPTKLIQ